MQHWSSSFHIMNYVITWREKIMMLLCYATRGEPSRWRVRLVQGVAEHLDVLRVEVYERWHFWGLLPRETHLSSNVSSPPPNTHTPQRPTSFRIPREKERQEVRGDYEAIGREVNLHSLWILAAIGLICARFSRKINSWIVSLATQHNKCWQNWTWNWVWEQWLISNISLSCFGFLFFFPACFCMQKKWNVEKMRSNLCSFLRRASTQCYSKYLIRWYRGHQFGEPASIFSRVIIKISLHVSNIR